ncbi:MULTISPECIES: hypothetical protein [Rhizobium]|uniref:hypothetical protein n=1 Tax=Rhizobium TaxID=379 RepID=UPI0028A93588|nr:MULTISPECIES: hypothetical protein [Rhizobium]
MTARGAFRQTMTVLSRDEDGMRVRWSLSADLPEGIAGLADSYQMNLLYRNSLTAYGTAGKRNREEARQAFIDAAIEAGIPIKE